MALQVAGCPLAASPRGGGGVSACPPTQGGPCPHGLLLSRVINTAWAQGSAPGARWSSGLLGRAGSLNPCQPRGGGGGSEAVGGGGTRERPPRLATAGHGPARRPIWDRGGGRRCGREGAAVLSQCQGCQAVHPSGSPRLEGAPQQGQASGTCEPKPLRNRSQMNPLSEVPRDAEGLEGGCRGLWASGPAQGSVRRQTAWGGGGVASNMP